VSQGRNAVEVLRGIQNRADGMLDVSNWGPASAPQLRSVVIQLQNDVQDLLWLLETRDAALQEAIAVVQDIARRPDDECGIAACTDETPACGYRVARAAMAGRLGRWKH
jgi:hypothetical protein